MWLPCRLLRGSAKGIFYGIGESGNAPSPQTTFVSFKILRLQKCLRILKVRERVQKLYRCLWRSLQEKGDSLEGEEWQEKWEQVQEDACWLGRKGDEWEFYLLEELVWNDHNYCAEVVDGEVPFWVFDDDLLEFAKHVGIEGCYQASNIECDPYNDQGECPIESEKVQKLVPYIHDFLNSTPWRGVYSAEETTEILDRLSVRRAQKLEVSLQVERKIYS